jgi:tetratricopeptide (TPR) repeat protein
MKLLFDIPVARKRFAWIGLAALAAVVLGLLLLWRTQTADRGPTPVPLPEVGDVDLATLDATVDDLADWNRFPEALAQVLAGQRQIAAAGGGDPRRLAELLLMEMDLRARLCELPEAEAAGARAVDVLDRHFGPNHVDAAQGRLRLARFLAEPAGKFPQAVEMWRRAIAILDQADGDAWLQPRLDLAEVLSQTCDHVNADTLLGETLAMAVAKQGAESLAAARVHLAHATWIKAAMKVDTGSANLGIYEAEAHLDQAWDILRSQAPPGDDQRRVCLKQMAGLVDQNDGNRRAILRLLLDEWLLVRNSHGNASLAAIQAGLDYAECIQEESPGREIIAHLVAAWQQLPPEEHLSEKGRQIFRDLAWTHFCPDSKALLASHLAELNARHAPGSLALAKAYLDDSIIPALVRQIDSPVAAEALLDDALATVTHHFGLDSPARIRPLWELCLFHRRIDNVPAQKKATDELRALIARNYGKRSLFAKTWHQQAADNMRDSAPRIRADMDLLDAQAAAWGEEHPARLPVLFDLAYMYAYVNTFSVRKAIFDRIDRLTLPRGSVSNSLWSEYFDFLDQPGKSRLPEAIATMDRAIAIARSTYGPLHPYLLLLMNIQADLLGFDHAHFDEVRQIHLDRIALAEQAYGKDSILVDPMMVKFDHVATVAGTPPADSRTRLRHRLASFRHRYEQRHPALASIQMEMAEAHVQQGDAAEALVAATEAVAIAREYRGRLPLLPDILAASADLSTVLGTDPAAEADEAESLREALSLPDDLRAVGLFPEFIKGSGK